MPHTAEPIEIVIIDDDQDHLALLTRALAETPAGDRVVADMHPHCYTDPAEALASLPSHGPVVILCDYSMPGATGLDWLPDFLRLDRGPVIMLTGHGDEEIAARAFRRGASDYLVKSHILEHPELLRRAISEAWRRHHLEHRNRELTRDLKLANEVLEAKNIKLRQMTTQAHRFVDDVAHDLRTPLAVIGEFAAIIQDGLDGPVTPQQGEHLGIIRSTVRELAQMVNDFLDSSRLKAGYLKIDRMPHEVPGLLEDVRPALDTQASLRSIAVEVDCDRGLPAIFADRSKVERVLTNLVQNAVKFSPPGSTITLSAWATDDDAVRVAVADEGPGMTAEQLEHVFRRFGQLDGDRDAQAKGFGLGLDIVRALVHLNLGQVHVESAPDRGSTFAFSLPVNRPDAIVTWFLASGEGPVTALEATIAGGATTPEGLRSFLASASYPMDVIFAKPDAPACVLVGRTAEPDEWMTRLRQLESAPPFELRCLGTWRGGPEARDEIIAASGLEAHATPTAGATAATG